MAWLAVFLVISSETIAVLLFLYVVMSTATSPCAHACVTQGSPVLGSFPSTSPLRPARHDSMKNGAKCIKTQSLDL
jgi:methionine-rich copper-binding protein CopC